jgi:hypothetical protein
MHHERITLGRVYLPMTHERRKLLEGLPDHDLLVLIADRQDGMAEKLAAHDKDIIGLKMWRTGLTAATGAIGTLMYIAWEGVKTWQKR